MEQGIVGKVLTYIFCFNPQLDCRYILIDTIGFLSDLPHELIPAFSITLEDTLQAVSKRFFL